MWYRKPRTARAYVAKGDLERSLRSGCPAEGSDSIEGARRANRGEPIYAVELPQECVECIERQYPPVAGASCYIPVPSGRLTVAADERAKVVSVHPSYNDLLYCYELEKISPDAARRVAGINWKLQRLSNQLQRGTQLLVVDSEEDTSTTWEELIQSTMRGEDWRQHRRTRLAEFTQEGFEITRDTTTEIELCASMLAEHRHQHDAADIGAAMVARAAAVVNKYASGGDSRLAAVAAAYASETIEEAREQLADFKQREYTATEDPQILALMEQIKSQETGRKRQALEAHRAREKNKATVANIIANREKGYMYATDEQMNERTVRAGTIDEIRFPSIPSAGYRWDLAESCRTTASMAEQTFESGEPTAPNGPVGSGGHDVFRLRFDKPGTYEMKFRYGRPWLGAEKTESIRYVVE